MWYDKKGKPLKDIKAAKLLEDKDYKIIKQEEVNDWFISTVWLGLDHSFDSGKPLIFETMVFPRGSRRGGRLNENYCERYATEEALKGHKETVKLYKKK